MTKPGGGGTRGLWVLRAALAIVVRPDLWATAIRQVLVLSADRWWAHAPFLPVPDPAYLRFRLQTAYGDAEISPAPRDVVTYLHWCRAWPQVTAHRG